MEMNRFPKREMPTPPPPPPPPPFLKLKVSDGLKLRNLRGKERKLAEWKQSPLHLRNHKDSKCSISKRKISEEQEFREESPMM